jgi:hypothetical protein
MTPDERRTTEEQIAKFRAALADPWRPLRQIEKGVDPIIIAAEEQGIRSIISDLEDKLRHTN